MQRRAFKITKITGELTVECDRVQFTHTHVLFLNGEDYEVPFIVLAVRSDRISQMHELERVADPA